MTEDITHSKKIYNVNINLSPILEPSMTTNEYHIDANEILLQMKSMKRFLENIESEKHDVELTGLLNDIITYIENRCCHTFIKDWIDIDPDNGKTIVYCIQCEKTI